jgi:hypothetical protein
LEEAHTVEDLGIERELEEIRAVLL